MLVSESFTNSAVSVSASFPDGGAPVVSAGSVTAAIVYNAASLSYTLTINGRSQTFRQNDVDPDLTNASQTVYVRQQGNQTDTLTLTKPGTTGLFTYRYVGSAFWQRTTESASATSGTFDALVYGVETPDAAMPIGGQAHFDVDLLGAYTASDGIVAITGRGSLQLDFATGGLVTYITHDAGWFQGKGQVSSSANLFSGAFTATAGAPSTGATYSGTFNGMFFGPGANELGASFSGVGVGTIAGTIMGRRGISGNNTDFDHLLVPELFATDRRRVVFDRNGSSDPATIVSTLSSALTIGFDSVEQSGQRLSFFLPEGLVTTEAEPDQSGLDDSSPLTYAGLSATLQAIQPGWLQYLGGQQYVRGGRLVQHDGDRFIFDEFVFGMRTPSSAVSTGTAAFDTRLHGTLFGNTYEPESLLGRGLLVADFATGQVSAIGAIWSDPVSRDSQYLGTYEASAAIASSSSAFNGSFIVEQGPISYSGDWDGAFFGPIAEEVGSSFLATGTEGSVMSGVILGDRDDQLISPFSALSELTEETTLTGMAAYVAETGGNPNYSPGMINPIEITYDPATGSYHIVPSEWAGNVGFGTIDAQFDLTDKVLSESDSSYDVYHTVDVDAEILNFGPGTNPVIELTYTSLAHVLQRHDACDCEPLTNEYWIAFGQQTPFNRAPQWGRATYTGIATGGGYVQGIGENARVTGTLVADLNFGSTEMTAAFDLLAEDPVGVATDVNLGVYSLAGALYHNQFDASGPNWAGDNSGFGMSGFLFGPNAEEIGGTWRLRVEGAGPDLVNVLGAFVAKQD